ncbi:hypothetical protein K438DRAFT_257660 [Mycena galopus ATCC 62051]|nr:hypothetical protein K438DRAFT_257660 [Mycena galopus ATCC 62051]
MAPLARHNLSGGFHGTCPQELIDLILGETDSVDKETLKSCALVARSFRPTSQKLIFSDLRILPGGRDNIPTLRRLADVLSASPHLALHVRTLHLVQTGLNESCVWMKSDILPAILSAFTNLESLNVRIFNWDALHPNCEQAIHALITQSSLASIEVKEARMRTKASLLSLLRCLPASLESASFLHVFADHRSYSDDTELHKLRLASLHLDRFVHPLYDWAMHAVDLEFVGHLYTTVEESTMDVVQELLDGAVNVETYHLFFDSCFSIPERPNLRKMQGLRMLEISVRLDRDEIEEADGQDRHHPLNDAMRSLDTAPHSVRHFVLNLNIWNPDQLSYFTESTSFDRLGKDWPALQEAVVRIVSGYEYDPALERGIRFLEAVFYPLHERGILKVVVARPPSRDDN